MNNACLRGNSRKMFEPPSKIILMLVERIVVQSNIVVNIVERSRVP
jgi:hypothetical protein